VVINLVKVNVDSIDKVKLISHNVLDLNLSVDTRISFIGNI